MSVRANLRLMLVSRGAFDEAQLGNTTNKKCMVETRKAQFHHALTYGGGTKKLITVELDRQNARS